jgi:Putative Flp pilus-assembly TadE/G-like
VLSKLDIRTLRVSWDEERGAVITWFALSLPLLIIAAGFVLNFAKWFEDKRHLQLQVDAAALSGGLDYSPNCNDATIAASALKYSGDTVRAASPYNIQPNDSSSVHVVLNQTAYWKTGDPTNPTGAATYGDLGSACSAQFLDVKATHDAPSFFFGSLVPNVLPAIHAHARVTLETLTGGNSLPVAVPQPAVLNARAYFVNESNGQVLQCGTPPAPCTVPLFDSGVVNCGGGECWTSFDPKTSTYYKLDVPRSVAAQVSVRIALSQNINNNQCGQALVTCYDDPNAPTTPSGLDHIRVYDQTATPPAAAPYMAVFGATLTPGNTNGCSNAYFAVLASGSTSCTVRLHVRASILSNATTTITPANVQMTVGAGNGAPTLAASTAASCPPGPGSCWESNQDISVSTIGSNSIDLTWADTNGADQINGSKCKNGGNPCTGTVTAVQRVFIADPTVSGQLSMVDVLDGNDPTLSTFAQHNYDTSSPTVSMGVEIGVQTGFTAAQAANAPVVFLRVAGKQNSNNNASQNQSLNCDPPNANFQTELQNGCQTEYIQNTGTACPANAAALFATTPPYQCVPVETGNNTNAVGKALNARLETQNGAVSCINPNNWPAPGTAPAGWTPDGTPGLPKADPRKLNVFLTPFNTFQGSGQGTFPVVGFATFYVTGWSGNGQDNDPCPKGNGPGQDTPIPGNDGGVLAGRFITNVAHLPKGGKGTFGCNLTALNTCIVQMTQ